MTRSRRARPPIRAFQREYQDAGPPDQDVRDARQPVDVPAEAADLMSWSTFAEFAALRRTRETSRVAAPDRH